MKTADFDYSLPEHLIAQGPLEQRDLARLLVVDNAALVDSVVRDFPSMLNAGDLVISNNTRVVHARLFGQKPTGGKAEFLIERPLADGTWLMQIGTNKRVRDGEVFHVEDARFTVIGREEPFFIVRIEGVDDAASFIDSVGRLPLPPYIKRDVNSGDEERYQTIFAQVAGAVAAPTAGLHFSEALMAQLVAKGVEHAEITLHVGAGTFRPVKSDDVSEHEMHAERVSVPADTVRRIAATRARGGRVIAIGTTTVRALESAALAHNGELRAYEGDTTLFITPGFRFNVVNMLLTNFHLPKSTLLMMVSAFAGSERIREAYQHAIECEYRFFSYGDAMLLTRTVA